MITFDFSDDNKRIVRQKGKSLLFFPEDYTLIDLETTGLDPRWDRIIEIGALRVRNHTVVDQYSTLVKFSGSNHIPGEITDITGITEEMVVTKGQPYPDALAKLDNFIGDDLITGFWVHFDINFVYDALSDLFGKKFSNDYVDFWRIARRFYPEERHNRLRDCMVRIGINRAQDHRGLQDCIDTKEVYDHFRKYAAPDLLANRAKPKKSFDLTSLTSETVQINTDNPFFDCYLCFTGKLDNLVRREAAQLVVNLGGHPQNSITTKTDFLVLGDTVYSLHGQGTVTAKLKRAHALIESGQDLTIINETLFLEMLKENEEETA